MEYTDKQMSFLSAAITKYGEGAILTTENITETAEENELAFPYWMTGSKGLGDITRVSKGNYRLPALNGGEGATMADVVETTAVVDKASEVVVESKIQKVLWI